MVTAMGTAISRIEPRKKGVSSSQGPERQMIALPIFAADTTVLATEICPLGHTIEETSAVQGTQRGASAPAGIVRRCSCLESPIKSTVPTLAEDAICRSSRNQIVATPVLLSRQRMSLLPVP